MSPNERRSADHPIEMISAYLDGQLAAPDRERIFEHLRDCAACQEMLSDFRALAVAARREGAPPIPVDLAERIGRRIGAEPAVRLTRRWFPVTRMRLPLATAAAVLVLSSLWIVWRGRLPGERAGMQPDAETAPVPAPDVPQAPSVSWAPAPSPPPAPPGGPGRIESEVSGKLDTLGDVGARKDERSSEPAGSLVEGRLSRSSRPVAAGTPAPAPLPLPDAPRPGEAAPAEERLAQAPEAQEEKKAAASLLKAIPAPEENRDPDAAAAAPGQEESAAGVRSPAVVASAPAAGVRAPAPAVGAPASGVAGYAVTPAASGPTLVFVMPEGRVSVLPDSRIILAFGEYYCMLKSGISEEDKALADLRAQAARRESPAAGADAPTEAPPVELVIPAPPVEGPLPPDLAARMHRRVRALVHERLLARAEAQCGPAPSALQGIR